MAHGGDCNVAVATKGYNTSTPPLTTKYKVKSYDNGNGGCCFIPESGNGYDNMTNINYPTINYSISCETMPFDQFNTPIEDKNMGGSIYCNK